ncbi:RNA polymerase sigma factor [Fodinicola acaciae]|uniref:RNA polymerase sigma factor n=1 Tax=Fodinicola acaciae TaxID=2681555 RepID=UPI0013D10635|nr:SigE family RNA polymerase sigma factor [Fodinicola acaciae]
MVEAEPAVEAVERLYREASGQLVLAAYALTGDLADAQDAVQEAFVKAFQRPSRVANADNPVAWMRTVTINIARGRYRRHRRLGVLLRRIPPDPAVPGLAPDRVAVLTAVSKLPSGQREAIALHYFADMSVEEIAVCLRTPAGTVKSRLSRGREALAGLLSDERPSGSDDSKTAYIGRTG